MRGRQPARLAVVLAAVVAAVQVDGQLAGLLRQPVLEGDLGPLPGRPPDRRPREAAAVGPHPRRAAGERLHLAPRGSGSSGARRAAPAGSAAAARRARRRARRPAAGAGSARPAARPQRQQRGQGAAAQGAEEGSAPQARRGWSRARSSRYFGRTMISPCIQGWIAHMKWIVVAPSEVSTLTVWLNSPPGFGSGEPGVAGLALGALGVPAALARLDRVLGHRVVRAFDAVPFGDRPADAFREAGFPFLRRRRAQRRFDQREGVRADLFRVGFVDDRQFFAVGDRFGGDEFERFGPAALDVDRVGGRAGALVAAGQRRAEGGRRDRRRRPGPGPRREPCSYEKDAASTCLLPWRPPTATPSFRIREDSNLVGPRTGGQGRRCAR